MQGRLQSFLLAVILLLSVIALPSTAMGITAANGELPGSSTIPASNSEGVAQHDTDSELRSGGRFWQGWQLGVDVSQLDAESIEVWLVTEDGELSQRVDTVAVDDSGTAVITTDELRGRYVLRFDGQPIYVQDGTAYLSSPPDGSEVTVESSSFDVVRQTLEATWSDPEVFPGQGTSLTLDSNRERFVLAVSSEGLSYENLTTLFPESTYAPEHDARAESDRLLVEVRSGDPILLNTSVLAPDSPRLRLDVSDTTVNRTKSLTVKAPASNGRFAAVEWRENVGDVLEVEVSCGTCYLVVGTPERGTVDLVKLSDADGDGQVRVHINTRYAGMYSGASGYPDQVRQYSSPDDTIVRYTPSSTLEQVDEELSYTVDTIGKLRDELGLRSVGRHRPLEPGALQLTLASSDFLIARSAWGGGPPYGSALVVRDETDARTVTLQPRSLDGVESIAAPAEEGRGSIVEELAGSPPTEVIATGDRLVFELSVSGIYGYFEAEGLSAETVAQNEGEGIDLALYDRSDGSEDRMDLDRLDMRFVPHESSETLYVVFETGGNQLGVVQEGTYRFEFSLEGVPPGNADYSIQDAFDGYPYLEPGGAEAVATTVSIEPPAAEISDPSSGSSPRLSNESLLEVRGVTNVATGSELAIEAASTEYAWSTTARAEVTASGDWEAVLEFSDAPGEEVTLTVALDGDVLAEGTFTVLPPETSPADEGAEDGGGDGGGDDSDGDGAQDGDPGPGDSAGGSIIPGVPNLVLYGGGIGSVVLLLVLLARVLL